jgi:hypothetical protein
MRKRVAAPHTVGSPVKGLANLLPAKGMRELFQASQSRPQRQRLPYTSQRIRPSPRPQPKKNPIQFYYLKI